MPICTFVRDSEKNIPTSNNEINDLLKTVRERTGEDWQVLELNVTKRRIFFRDKTEKAYNILVHVGGFADYQSINFYRENTRSSINECVPAELIVAYLYGILAGVKHNTIEQD